MEIARSGATVCWQLCSITEHITAVLPQVQAEGRPGPSPRPPTPHAHPFYNSCLISVKVCFVVGMQPGFTDPQMKFTAQYFP